MEHWWWLRTRVQRSFMTPAACALPAGRARRRLCLAASGVLLLPLAAPAQDAEVIYEVRSQYQLITVRDTANGFRQLIFDGNFDGTDAIQSEMNLASPDELTLSYSQHIMAALPVVSRPRRVLVVGLGGACIQRYLHRLLPDATIETAELDPVMKDVAAKYFFFKEDARQIVRLGDGRAFVESSKDRYDIIFLDAFSARSIPYHLTTREFLQAVKDHLADGGVVGANLWDGVASYWDQVRTYAAVFPELHVVKCAGSGNSIVLAVPAKTGLTVQAWAEKAAAFEKARPTGLDLPRLILRGAAGETSIPESARVLADKAKTEGAGRIRAVPLPHTPPARKEPPPGRGSSDAAGRGSPGRRSCQRSAYHTSCPHGARKSRTSQRAVDGSDPDGTDLWALRNNPVESRAVTDPAGCRPAIRARRCVHACVRVPV